MSVCRMSMFCDSIMLILQVFLLTFLCNGQAKEFNFKDNCSKYGQICVNNINCSSTKQLIDSKQALPCGFRGKIFKKVIKICCNPSDIIPATTSSTSLSPEVIREQDIKSPELPKNTQSSRNSTAVALQKCQEYGRYRYVKKWQDPNLPGEEGHYYDMLDCVNAQPLIAKGTPAEAKEYPHMALIGYGKEFESVSWNCGGSLISEKFIMSAAHCTDNNILGPPRWVLLGALNKFPTKDDPQRKVYSIVKVYNHPNYKSSSYYHDISLFQLNTTVEFSPYVRPACLYTSNTDSLINTRASITGWGGTGAAEKPSDKLLKATIMVVDHQNCTKCQEKRAKLERGYDSNTMICAGDTEKGRDTCLGDSGGPLQIPIPNASCMWNVIGVTSFGPGNCGNNQEPSVYTKVSYSLDWIQSIVWP
ncbi:serine protease snake-like [Planococcus citri]|uniref:serine protease snake-like n=1 Tax=Planococcus citri TaxID=170843 RepID=UPI0031F80177